MIELLVIYCYATADGDKCAYQKTVRPDYHTVGECLSGVYTTVIPKLDAIGVEVRGVACRELAKEEMGTPS